MAEANSRLAAAGNEPPPGPTQDEIDAAADMSAEDRNAMIEQMVARLDERLRQNPRDLEGWRGSFVPTMCSAGPMRRAMR